MEAVTLQIYKLIEGRRKSLNHSGIRTQRETFWTKAQGPSTWATFTGHRQLCQEDIRGWGRTSQSLSTRNVVSSTWVRASFSSAAVVVVVVVAVFFVDHVFARSLVAYGGGGGGGASSWQLCSFCCHRTTSDAGSQSLWLLSKQYSFPYT